LTRIGSSAKRRTQHQSEHVHLHRGRHRARCLSAAWTENGGYPALFKRLRDPATRKQIAAEVSKDSDEWENLYVGAGSPDQNSARGI